MIRAVFPGSFDPPTYGHINIIERACAIFDELHVVIAVNSEKHYMFSESERIKMMVQLVERWPNVSVHTCNDLIVTYAKKNNASVLIRGIRNMADFSYEFDLSVMNRGLNPSGIETLFMPTDQRFFVLRSSAIKELAYYGGDVSAMVPPIVAEELRKKFDKK